LDGAREKCHNGEEINCDEIIKCVEILEQVT